MWEAACRPYLPWQSHCTLLSYEVFLATNLIVLNVYNKALSCFRVSLEEMYNGKTAKLQLSKNVICTVCDG
jgi:hypothetical protein